jgi:hypothetical protein
MVPTLLSVMEQAERIIRDAIGKKRVIRFMLVTSACSVCGVREWFHLFAQLSRSRANAKCKVMRITLPQDSAAFSWPGGLVFCNGAGLVLSPRERGPARGRAASVAPERRCDGGAWLVAATA